jgi:hypothetical protein
MTAKTETGHPVLNSWWNMMLMMIVVVVVVVVLLLMMIEYARITVLVTLLYSGLIHHQLIAGIKSQHVEGCILLQLHMSRVGERALC